MASAPETKRQKTGAESTVGPEELRSWVSKSAARFCPEMRANLLSSRNIHAADVLKFVLEFVFGWSEVEDGTGDSNYYSSITYKDRAMALEFVTQWLGKNPDGQASSLPSLTTLCAQKIAMEVFWLFTTNIDRNFRRSNIEFFTDALKSDMASSLNNKRVPESHHTLIIEELFIFTTIYILYVDLQRLSDEPTEASDLLLPVQTRACGDEWWYNFGMSAAVDAVPDHGWGGLAKVALLPFIVCTNYTTIRRRDMNMIGYGHLEVVFKMFGCDYVNHRYVNARLHSRHPFASSVALTPLASLVRAIVTGDGFRGSEVDEDIVDEVLLPWIKQHARITQRDTSSFSVMYAAAMQSVNPPVPARLRPFQYATLQKAAQDCVDTVEYKELIESLTFHYYREDQHIKRLRMNGNYSKMEILRAVIISKYAEVVDLEDCSNLDEECFDAVMRQLFRVRVVLLKGTAVDENSAVVKRYRNSDICFVFSTARKCCGAVKGRIKELGGSNNS